MSAQRLDEWLKAAADDAAQDGPDDLHLAHAGGALDRAGGWSSNEADLDQAGRYPFKHSRQATAGTASGISAHSPIACLVGQATRSRSTFRS